MSHAAPRRTASTSIQNDIKKVVADPHRWLDTPNNQLGGKKPRELLGTPEEKQVRNLIEAIKLGLPS